jgi:hypothetical protein
LRPFWVELNATKPVTTPIRLKAQTDFQYFIPLDIFQSSAPEIVYTKVTSTTDPSLMPTNIVFDNPNVIRGNFPNTGTFDFTIEAADKYNVKTTTIQFIIGNVGPTVGDIVPILPWQPLRNFSETIPVPCTDPDGDALLVTMTTAPPSWVKYSLNPGVKTTQAQSIYLSGFVPASAVNQVFTFGVTCADAFASVSYTQTITIKNSQPPELIPVVSIPPVQALRRFESTLPVPCTDPDGNAILVTMTKPPPTWVNYTLSFGGKATTQAQSLYISGSVPASALNQVFTFGLTCTDPFASVSYNQTITVLNSQPPELVSKFPNITVDVYSEAKRLLNAYEFFSDPDDDQYSVYVEVPTAIKSWVDVKVITPLAIDPTVNAQNNERIQIVAAPPLEGWKDAYPDDSMFYITIWAVDQFGMSSPKAQLTIIVHYTWWMRAAPTLVPIVATVASLLFIALLVCLYPCLFNFFFKRRSAIIDPCPLTKSNPTYVFPEGTAKVEISVRHVGCVWPFLAFLNGYVYDQWTLKPMSEMGRNAPTWLELEDGCVTFVPDHKRGSGTKEVVLRCFTGGGVLLSQFTANFDLINGGGSSSSYAPPQQQQQKRYGHDDEEMRDQPLLRDVPAVVTAPPPAVQQQQYVPPQQQQQAPPAPVPVFQQPQYQQPVVAPPPPPPPIVQQQYAAPPQKQFDSDEDLFL